jgi:hypothetical protein
MRFDRIFFFFTLLMMWACLDPYNPPADSNDYGYLVVDGFVNSNDGSGTITLSRTKPLNSDAPNAIVTNAQISIIDANGNTYGFFETGNGQYALSGAAIDLSKTYKLTVTTGSKTYESDFVPVRVSPPIDSISWRQLDDDIEIYANTHDPSNNTRYYRWSYSETWHYTSAFNSVVVLNKNHSVSNRKDNIYDCYQSHNAGGILILSTTKLQDDAVREFVLNKIPTSDVRLKSVYSIEVKQYALTKEAYEYWQELSKTTETPGTLFSPQPSQVTGNMHCVTNPSEPVIGYFSLGAADTKRIFIKPKEIVFPQFSSAVDDSYVNCLADTLLTHDVPRYAGTDLLISAVYYQIFLVGYLKSSETCVDCRLKGGTNVKPDFWP